MQRFFTTQWCHIKEDILNVDGPGDRVSHANYNTPVVQIVTFDQSRALKNKVKLSLKFNFTQIECANLQFHRIRCLFMDNVGKEPKLTKIALKYNDKPYHLVSSSELRPTAIGERWYNYLGSGIGGT